MSKTCARASPSWPTPASSGSIPPACASTRCARVVALDMLYVGPDAHAAGARCRSAARRAARARRSARLSKRPIAPPSAACSTASRVRVMNLRYARIGVRPKFDLAVLAPKARAAWRHRSARKRVFHAGAMARDATRFARLELPVGARSTVPRSSSRPTRRVARTRIQRAEVDALGNLLITRKSD